jgi:nucleoside-diphosphate-sugar epimerase
MIPIKHRILVTGPDGFVGTQLCNTLLKMGQSVAGAQWKEAPIVRGVTPVVIGDIAQTTDWKYALGDIDTVIHLAARVHIMNDTAEDPLNEFRNINVFGTKNLARQAAQAGVKRIVFISTIKVLGEESDTPYTEESGYAPQDPYAISKMEAEQCLQKISRETGIEIVVIRPPLVYGPGVKANFLNLLRITSKGFPLPLASPKNKRSLIYVGNLADAIATCAVHPNAGGKTFLVSDGEDKSTPELISAISKALARPARLFPFPTRLMRLAGKLLGKSAAIDRLAGSLQVDSGKIRKELGWNPPYSMQEGLNITAKWFKEHEKNL